MKKSKDISSKVDQLLNGLVGRLEKLEKITIEQFPEICKEIIAERKTELENKSILAGTFLIIMLLVRIASVIVIHNHDYMHVASIFSMIFGGISVILFFITLAELLASFLNLRTLNSAPKLYVLRQLKYMVSR